MGLPFGNAAGAATDLEWRTYPDRGWPNRVLSRVRTVAGAGRSARRPRILPQLFTGARRHRSECILRSSHPDDRIAAFHCGAMRMSLHIPGMSGWYGAAVVGLGSIAALYAPGTRRLTARGAHVRSAGRIAFWLGWIAALVALVPPIDTIAQQLFSVHMFQHELLMLLALP